MGVPRLMPQGPFCICVVITQEERRCPFWRYTQLYATLAPREQLNDIPGLNASPIQVFSKPDTNNFELIPSALRTASLLVDAIGQDPAIVDK
jgi:hypothetical protein